ncbi:MAG: amidohydrolase [Desulfobacterales bacterium]|nr:amidohydrolase [Desulfobacterales bacterium]MBS3754788.1 amidohydrolase [Desulfobacterales bacterium]
MTIFHDLLIVNGTLVTMDEADTVIENGAVAVSGDAIGSVGPADTVDVKSAARIIDADGGIIMPGLVNTHTHAAMTCFRGLADDMELMTWLNDYIFPAEARLDHDKVYTGALLACAEMALSGTTCFSDMYLFEGAVAEAASHAGMRAVVGEVLYDFDSPNYGPIEKGFEYTEDLIHQWQNDPLITIAVEPHSPYLCAPQLLQRASAISQQYGIPIIVHVAETRAEAETMKNRYNLSPVAHLADIGVLSPRLVTCHCVAVNKEDIELLRAHDVKVSHNPESNMKLASGIAPVPDMLSSGVCVGLGTDGPTSNNNLDMFMEMDAAAKIHKARSLDPTVMDARSVLRMATIDAARTLGLDHEIGSLEPGKKADIILIDTKKPHLTPMYNVYSHLVYAVSGHDVHATIINGVPVVTEGRMTTFDTDRVMDAMKPIAEEIRHLHDWDGSRAAARKKPGNKR